MHPDDRITTGYEWVIETLDIEPGQSPDDAEDADIVEVSHADRLSEVTLEWNQRVGLVRDRGSNAEGLLDRQYAYPEYGVLPSHCNGGAKVPGRYIAEYAAWASKA